MAPFVGMEAVTLMAPEAYWACWPLSLHPVHFSQTRCRVMHTPRRAYTYILIEDGRGSSPTS